MFTFALFRVLELNCCWACLHSAVLIWWFRMGSLGGRSTFMFCLFPILDSFRRILPSRLIENLQTHKTSEFYIFRELTHYSLLVLAYSENMKRFAFKFIWYQDTLLKKHRKHRKIIMDMFIKFNNLSITKQKQLFKLLVDWITFL